MRNGELLFTFILLVLAAGLIAAVAIYPDKKSAPVVAYSETEQVEDHYSIQFNHLDNEWNNSRIEELEKQVRELQADDEQVHAAINAMIESFFAVPYETEPATKSEKTL